MVWESIWDHGTLPALVIVGARPLARWATVVDHKHCALYVFVESVICLAGGIRHGKSPS